MIGILLLLIIICFFAVPYFRCFVFHPLATLYYGIVDSFKYVFFRKKHIPKVGSITCYSAHFGKGKTLSAVDYLTLLYHKYNNKRFYNSDLKKWQRVKIVVLSNVDMLQIPYILLTSLSQITDLFKSSDISDDYCVFHYVLIDEASVQLNSRNFKTNIDAVFLNSLLTCRHFNGNIIYTSQKFKLTDALFRSVTQKVIQCSKLWRFVVLREYDADEVEERVFINDCKPIRTRVYFATNKKYRAYNTNACVGNLIKEYNSGGMLSTEEIISNLCWSSGNSETPSVGFFGRIFRRK